MHRHGFPALVILAARIISMGWAAQATEVSTNGGCRLTGPRWGGPQVPSGAACTAIRISAQPTIQHVIEVGAWQSVPTKGSRPMSLASHRKAADEFEVYIRNNACMIPNYAERTCYSERVSTGFVESAINAVVGNRFGKRQQMRWSKPGSHLMLHTRTRALNGTLREKFEQWYPGLKNDDAAGKAQELAA